MNGIRSITDLFNRDTVLSRTPVNRGEIKGHLEIQDGPPKYQRDISRPRFGNEYADRFIQQEIQEYFEVSK